MDSIFVTITLLFLWPLTTNGHYFEWLVPKDLHKCCGDTISNYPECKSIDAAAYINGSMVLFSGSHFIHTKVRDSRFPQILHDQSIKSIKQWNFRESPQRARATEVEAAVHDGNHFVVKKGDILYTFSSMTGSGDWLSCSKSNGLECRKGGRGLEAMARFYGNDNVKYFITYHQRTASAEKDGQSYEVSVKRGPKEWRSYSLNEESDTVDAMAVYNVRHGMTPLNVKTKENDPSASEVINYAVYFNAHGYACFFELTGDELDTKSFYKIEHPAITPGVPMADCTPLNVFFGCPQSWCYNNDADDMIVTQTLDDVGSNRESIIIYRGHYYWIASLDSGVPIYPASVRQQHLAMADSMEGIKSVWYIDAAEAMSVETRDFILYFIDEKLLLYKSNYGNDPEVHSDGKYDPDRGIGYEEVNIQDSQIYGDLNDVFPGKKCRQVDTLWYNKFDAVLYMFCGAHFQAFDVSFNPTEGIPVFTGKKFGNNLNKITDYFEGLPPDLDASLMIKNKVYMTKQQYYYMFEVQLDTDPYNEPGDGKDSIKPKLAFGSRMRTNETDESYGLFATQQMCGYSDETMAKIRTRFGDAERPLDKNGVHQMMYQGRMYQARSESGPADWPLLTGVVAAIVGIVGLIAVGYATCRLKAKRNKEYTEEVFQR